jgi:hypothetical protein
MDLLEVVENIDKPIKNNYLDLKMNKYKPRDNTI